MQPAMASSCTRAASTDGMSRPVESGAEPTSSDVNGMAASRAATDARTGVEQCWNQRAKMLEPAMREAMTGGAGSCDRSDATLQPWEL